MQIEEAKDSGNKLDELRQRLTSDQHSLLNAIWEYFCEKGEWIVAKVLHSRYGKPAVRSTLDKLGGSVVFEMEDHQKGNRYQLTLLGVLLTEQGPTLERLLVRYLDYCRAQFQSKPENNQVNSKDVESALDLTFRQTQLLGCLIEIGHLWSGTRSGSGSSAEGWSAGLPEDVDDFPSVGDLRAYLRSHVMKDYNPDLPFGLGDRSLYIRQPAPRNDFWFVHDPDLRQQLEEDWREAQAVHQVQAWKSCVILCGGVLEGMLLDALAQDQSRREAEFQRIYQRRAEALDRWDLIELATVANKMGILRKGIEHVGHALREFRNLIHPGKQIREKVKLSEEEAQIAIDVVKVYMRDMADRETQGSSISHVIDNTKARPLS